MHVQRIAPLPRLFDRVEANRLLDGCRPVHEQRVFLENVMEQPSDSCIVNAMQCDINDCRSMETGVDASSTADQLI
jgi:hypothetical protein